MTGGGAQVLIWFGLALTSLVVVVAAVLASAGLQYIQLFYRARWRARLALPDPCYYLEDAAPGGGPLRLFVHSSRPFEVTVRHAVTAGAPLWSSGSLPAETRSGAYDRWRGFDWQGAVEVPTDALADGPQVVEVSSELGRYLGVGLVRRKRASVVVVASTHTWHAYNDFGDLSNYNTRAIPAPLRLFVILAKAMNISLRLTDRVQAPIIPLPLKRPQRAIDEDLKAGEQATPGASHLARAELSLLRQLDRIGTAYSVVTDAEWGRGAVGADVRLVIFAAHSEYWTHPGIAALNARLAHGGSVAFLSGNNVYRRVEQLADRLQVVEQTIDPDRMAGVLGAAYDTQGYLSFAGYRAVQPDHWLLDGTGLGPGDGFGRGDGSAANPGASGYETDKRRWTSPGDALLVAIGENAEGPAHFTCRDLPGGGFLVNAGSVSFTSGLGSDAVLDRILENILGRAGAA